jgi:hypothetical protein
MNLTRTRTFVLALLAAALTSTCAITAPRDPAGAVRTYLAASTREQALQVLAPEYRLWFGQRQGEGLDRTHVAAMLEWDFALHPRHRIVSLESRGSEVSALVHEDNDFSLLIGFPGWDATSTYTVTEDGTIASQVYVPVGATDWRPYLDAPLAWIRANRPDVLPRIFPDGKLRQDGTAAREWVETLRAWRAATGLPDPTR